MQFGLSQVEDGNKRCKKMSWVADTTLRVWLFAYRVTVGHMRQENGSRADQVFASGLPDCARSRAFLQNSLSQLSFHRLYAFVVRCW